MVLLTSPLIDSVIRSTPSPSEGICGRSLFISVQDLSVGAPPQREWWTSGGSSGARRREEVQESPLHWDRYRGGGVFLSLSGNPQQSVREERGNYLPTPTDSDDTSPSPPADLGNPVNAPCLFVLFPWGADEDECRWNSLRKIIITRACLWAKGSAGGTRELPMRGKSILLPNGPGEKGRKNNRGFISAGSD